MSGEDQRDRAQSRKLLLLIGALLLVLAAALVLLLPEVLAIFSELFAPGLGLKQAAVIAFFITVVLMIVFTLSAGDGLLGELQYVLGAFLGFFLIIWLMLAWIF